MINQYKLFLRQAYNLATRCSTDISTHVGTVILNKQMSPAATGFNTFTDRSQFELPSNFNRPRKYQITEHAERAAIYAMARKGESTEGTTLVCPWASCPDCARAIVLSGIKTVVGHREAYEKTPDRWKEEIDIGMEILLGGGVKYIFYEGDIGSCQNLFNGEIWYP